MRKNGIIFLVILLFFAVLFLYIYSNSQTKQSNQLTANEKEFAFRIDLKSLDSTLNLEGKIGYSDTVDLAFKVKGILEAGEMDIKAGTKFKKSQLLFQINNRLAFLNYLQSKNHYHSEILAAILLLEKIISSDELLKWKNFANTLQENQLVTVFPSIVDSEEQSTVQNLGLLKNYNSLKSIEAGLSDYFYLAPYDGVVVGLTAKIGQNLKVNQKIVRFVSTDKKSLRFAMDSMDYNRISEVQKILISNGNANLLLDWDDRQMKSLGSKVVLTFSIEKRQKFAIGEILSVKISYQTKKIFAVVPRKMVQNSSVNVVGSKIKTQVEVIQIYGDSMLICGLKQGIKIAR